MYGQINLKMLDEMIEYAKATPERFFEEVERGHVFQMDSWGRLILDGDNHVCGTAGCLVGTWMVAKRRNPALTVDPNRYRGETTKYSRVVKMESGLSNDAWAYLFENRNTRCSRFCSRMDAPGAPSLNKHEAIARLSKHVEHIRDMQRKWANHEWQMSLPKKVRRKLLGLTPVSTS